MRHRRHLRKHSASAEAQRYRAGRDTFVLYRIIGNDLPPRHQDGQSRQNIEFILQNEPPLEDCETWWVINRIFDEANRTQLIELLDRHKQRYIEIPFDWDAYRGVKMDTSLFPTPDFLTSDAHAALDADAQERAVLAHNRRKNLYIMNNNGARNTALDHGRNLAKWVLPWDGNCFLTEDGWRKIRQGVIDSNDVPYHLVPMARVDSNSEYLNEETAPNATEEPQIIFHAKSRERFNDAIPYGRRPKVDLMRRLQSKGPWSFRKNDPWDVPAAETCPDAWRFVLSPGWVGRLSSGDVRQEKGRNSAETRMQRRNQAILAAIAMVDAELEARSTVQSET
ncbi:hypothetical protein [Litoreibacter roseus]|nr:hypothetical protein [Litoreibacter roseus]